MIARNSCIAPRQGLGAPHDRSHRHCPVGRQIASIKASLTALDALQAAIVSAAQANQSINADEGAGSLYGFVRGVRSKFSDPDETETKQQMPAAVVKLLSKEIVPALADIVTEFKQLWIEIQDAVEANGMGQPLIDAYLTRAEDSNSALMRTQNGLEELQALALQNAVDQLAAMLF